MTDGSLTGGSVGCGRRCQLRHPDLGPRRARPDLRGLPGAVQPRRFHETGRADPAAESQDLRRRGGSVTRGRLVSPPLVQLFYTAAVGDEPVDVTDAVVPAGRSNKGQAFRNAGQSLWIYNLKTKKNLPEGTYTIQIDSANATEYLIDSTCTGSFVIEAPAVKKNPKKNP